jgi:mono/diheme cytochrome c family protein
MKSGIKALRITAFAVSLFLTAMIIQASPTGGSPSGEAENLYKAKCAMCHGIDLSGNTTMGKKLGIRDLRSSQVQAQSDAQLHSIIAKGKGKMAGYEQSLSQQQINDLVAFIRSKKR